MIVNPIVVGGGGSVPPGVICMWSGSSTAIPTGWALCDGTNNTPDLRGRFVVGAGSAYKAGDTGGAESVTLTTSQMPSHSHGGSVSTESAGAHNHMVFVGAGSASANEYYFASSALSNNHTNGQGRGRTAIGSAGSHTHTATLSISNTGSGNPHENRPPYYALCYIMKLPA